MTQSANPLDAIRALLEVQTSKELALACIMQPNYCRKFLTLERLVELLQIEGAVLAPSRALENTVRPEVVRRLLVHGNRKGWREPFLRLFLDKHLRCPKLYQFVEESYLPRSVGEFKSEEKRYLDALTRVYNADSEYREPIAEALAWFGALVGQSSNEQFRVLFSNASTSARFPAHLLAGVCISFAFRSKRGTEPFEPWDLDRLGVSFRRAAVEAEEKSYELCQKPFGAKKSRRIRIVEDLEDTSFFDGASGYLAFLMAHLCQLRDLPISPYIGYTGAYKGMGQLGSVADLPQKLAAAVQAGMHIVFVPQSDFRKLTPQQQIGFGILRLVPFDDHGAIDPTVNRLIEAMKNLSAQVPQPDAHEARSDALAQTVATPVSKGKTPWPRADSADLNKSRPKAVEVDVPPEKLRAAEKLFPSGQLRTFLEWGGFHGLDVPAAMCAFSDDLDTFVTLFPQRHRIYLFDAFGNLLEKLATDVPPRQPLCVAWNSEANEYLVGFDDGRISRFSPHLNKVLGHFQTPDRSGPRFLAAAGQSVFASSGGTQLVRFDARGGGATVELAGPISQVVYAESLDKVLVSLPDQIVALTRDLQLSWQSRHSGSSALVASGPQGDIWVVTTSGRLTRLAGDDRRTLVEARTTPNASGLVVMEKVVLIGTQDGQLLLHDTVGREIGRDDLRTELFHMAVGSGDILAISTARGPTVLKPNPQVIDGAEVDGQELSMRLLDRLIRLAKEGNMAELKTVAANIDLDQWRPVIALQTEYQKRKKADPAGCLRMEEALRFHDLRKADCICTRTRPAFIDGSNVSRDHWGNDRNPNRKARLSSILRMREKLLREINPVLYPIITVVDVTERHFSDKRGELLRLIEDGVIQATPTEREADALILNCIKANNWLDCEIVSNDKKMFDAHSEMLPGADHAWYQRVRRKFAIDHRTGEITFVERSR
jgi:hypothetical protein